MENIRRHRISAIMAKKAVGGTITREDKDILEKWIGESPLNKERYDKFMSGETYDARHKIDPGFIAKVENKIYRHNLHRRFRIASLSAAAVVAIGLFSTVLMKNRDFSISETTDTMALLNQYQAVLSFEGSGNYMLKSEGEGNEWQQIVKTEIGNRSDEPDSIVTIKVQVPRGSNYKVQLEDGTMVWLNAETTIKYPSKFTGERRNVHVTGEAYFEVAHNPSRPFVITTEDDLDITVLGTKFNVCNYSDAPEVQVTLAEGSVAVRQKDRNCILTPSRQAVFTRDDEQLSIREVDISKHIAWINGIFDFRSKTLSEIYSELAKWYNIEFITEDVDLSTFGHFTLTADRGDNFTQVQEILHKITGLNYRVDGHKIYVSR